MLFVEYSFFPKDTVDRETYLEEVNWFLTLLYRNGQITKEFSNLYKKGRRVLCNCIAVETGSLDAAQYSQYCRKCLEGLVGMSEEAPRYRVLGETLDADRICRCPSPSCYFLYTCGMYEHEPVTCGDCNGSIPLYRLPYIAGREEYSPVLDWRDEYVACDKLFLHSQVGERFGYRQISRVDSPLSQEGMALCREWEEKTGKPFYYFLYKYYGKQKDTCPVCGGNWRLSEPLHGFFGFRCDSCRLISNLSQA